MLNDLRYALRSLRQNPGFAFTAIVSIALAIGANAAIFSLGDAVLMRPLPVRDPTRVVSLRSISPSSSATSLVGTGTDISYPDFVDFRDKSHSFDGLVAYTLKAAGFAKDEHTQARLKMGYVVSGNLFQVLGVEPVLGRAFRPDEDEVPERDAVIVLAHNFWMEEFAAAPSVIGSRIRLNGIDFTVIGVAPESFTGMDQYIQPAFFVPFMMAPKLDAKENLHSRDLRELGAKGRLKPKVTLQAANAEISSIAKSLEESYPTTNKGFGAAVRTENQIRLDRNPSSAAQVTALFTLVAVVLLIACSNVANLVLGRGRARAREIAVRLAIGASRFRLFRQLMAENILIALAGGALGVLFAEFAIEFFSTVEFLTDEPIKLDFEIGHRVLLFSLLVSIASAILFGAVPALQSTKADLGSALKAGSLHGGRKHFFGRDALVIAQLAGSLVLLMHATGAYRTSASMLVNRGFRIDHLLTMRFDTEVGGYTSKQSEQFYTILTDRTRTLAGVKSVALTYTLPLSSNTRLRTVIPEGYQFPVGQKSAGVFSSTVDEHYFETIGIPRVRGRGFLSTDTSDSPRVAIVNEAFAAKYLTTDPIGKRIRLEGATGPLVEVVGITATSKYLFVGESPTGFLYLPLTQNPEPRLTMLVEACGDPAPLSEAVRELVRSIDANVPILSVRTMEDVFQRTSVQGMNLVITIFGVGSLIGLVLALVGLYAVVAYQVARRTREIGIRMALGAERQQVMRMVLKHAATVGVAGINIGLILSYALGGVFRGSAPDPAQVSAVSGPSLFMILPIALLLTTLLAAAAIPARRASRVDPMIALREE
jgi:predicted permease